MQSTITLQSGRDKRVRAGHPWVYSNEIQMTPAAKALEAGTLVTLADARGVAFATAMFNPHSLIAARLLAWDAKAAIEEPWLRAKLEAALALRERLFPAPYYRLVHAEADGMPGLVVDRYDDALAVQINTAGMERLRQPLLDALRALLAPRTLVLRNDSAARGLEQLESQVETVTGTDCGRLPVEEEGVRFLADPWRGQKTGWFFDQRDNRRFVAGLASGRRVADFYCHTGGFAVRAAAQGAESVLAVDRSAPALELAEAAAAENGVAAKCRFLRGDAMAEMEVCAKAGERFDLVISDPPSFVKSRKDLKAGAKGYRKMARLSAGLVAKGGILFVASCSHNVTPDLFQEQVRQGIADAGRQGRILRAAGASPDHPVHVFLPETAYLKSLTLQLD